MKIISLVLITVLATGFASVQSSSTISDLWRNFKHSFKNRDWIQERKNPVSRSPPSLPTVDLAGFGKSLMQQVLSSYGEPLKNCYLNFLRTEPQGTTEGSLTAHWIIDSAGEVKKIELADGEIQDEGLRKCINDELAKVSHLKPPPNGQEFQFQQKFKFKRNVASDLNFDPSNE